MKKKIIYGCESRGDAQSAYLTRYTLFSLFGYEGYLHIFHRSDSPEQHDHPWNFVSVILWRGYIEETHQFIYIEPGIVPLIPRNQIQRYVKRENRVWPGMILFRRATHRHRVVLVDDKPAVTLVLRGRYKRQWGFFTSKGWQHWKEYFAERGC